MDKKKFVIDNVCKLNMSQIDELIEIVNANDVNHMKNTNGLFIYLKNVHGDIIQKMYEHIQYCLDQKKQGYNEDNYEYNSMQHLEKFLGIDNKTGDPVIPLKVPELVIQHKVKKKIIKDKIMQKKSISFTETQKQIISFSRKI